MCISSGKQMTSTQSDNVNKMQDEINNKSLYFACVPKELAEDDVRQLFLNFGQVRDVILFRKSSRSTASKGCGIVLYSTHEEALNALMSLDGKEMFGAGNPAMVVKWAYGHSYGTDHFLMSEIGPEFTQRASGVPEGCAPDAIKLYIGNVPLACTEADLLPLFQPYGTVVELSIMRDKITGTSQGCAFVWMQRREMAEVAMKDLNLTRRLQDPTGLQKAPLVVRPARAKPRQPSSRSLNTTSPGSSGTLPIVQDLSAYGVAGLQTLDSTQQQLLSFQGQQMGASSQFDSQRNLTDMLAQLGLTNTSGGNMTNMNMNMGRAASATLFGNAAGVGSFQTTSGSLPTSIVRSNTSSSISLSNYSNTSTTPQLPSASGVAMSPLSGVPAMRYAAAGGPSQQPFSRGTITLQTVQQPHSAVDMMGNVVNTQQQRQFLLSPDGVLTPLQQPPMQIVQVAGDNSGFLYANQVQSNTGLAMQGMQYMFPTQANSYALPNNAVTGMMQAQGASAPPQSPGSAYIQQAGQIMPGNAPVSNAAVMQQQLQQASGLQRFGPGSGQQYSPTQAGMSGNNTVNELLALQQNRMASGQASNVILQQQGVSQVSQAAQDVYTAADYANLVAIINQLGNMTGDTPQPAFSPPGSAPRSGPVNDDVQGQALLGMVGSTPAHTRTVPIAGSRASDAAASLSPSSAGLGQANMIQGSPTHNHDVRRSSSLDRGNTNTGDIVKTLILQASVFISIRDNVSHVKDLSGAGITVVPGPEACGDGGSSGGGGLTCGLQMKGTPDQVEAAEMLLTALVAAVSGSSS